MIKKGYRYKVLEDMYFIKADEIVESGNQLYHSGVDHNICFTSYDILKVIKRFTDLLNDESEALFKGYEIEVLKIEYEPNNNCFPVVTYIEFMVFIPYAWGFEVKLNSVVWGFIREDLLKKIGKNTVYKNIK